MRLQSLKFDKSSRTTTHHLTSENFFKHTRIRSQIEATYKEEKIQEIRRILGNSAKDTNKDKITEGRKSQLVIIKEPRKSQ